MIIILKADNFKLWFLYKSDFSMKISEKNINYDINKYPPSPLRDSF